MVNCVFTKSEGPNNDDCASKKEEGGNTLIPLNARNTWGSLQPTICKWWDDTDSQYLGLTFLY